MKKELKGFILGIICMLLITGTTFAENLFKTIQVIENGVNIQVNGQIFTVSNFTHNGRTYVQVRDLINALNKNLEWDSVTNTISINDKDKNSKQEEITTLKNLWRTARFTITDEEGKVIDVTKNSPIPTQLGTKESVFTLENIETMNLPTLTNVDVTVKNNYKEIQYGMLQARFFRYGSLICTLTSGTYSEIYPSDIQKFSIFSSNVINYDRIDFKIIEP